MNESVEARVARGAAWLDRQEPGWERRIDLARLNLANGCRCVLGQVFSEVRCSSDGDGYDHALDCCGVPYFGRTYGFEIEPHCEEDAYAVLDEAWIALIKERFSSGLLSDES